MMTAGNPASGTQGDDWTIVEPGQTATLIHTFDKPGAVIVGCHQQDHYKLGMRIRVTVA